MWGNIVSWSVFMLLTLVKKYPAMARLWAPLFFLALAQCQLRRVDDWQDWSFRCGMRSNTSKELASWTALVFNKDKELAHSAVIISQRHVITIKAAVTQTVEGTETVIDTDYIKVAPIISKYGESQTVYDVQRSIIPVRMEHEFDKPILHNLAILQVSVDFHANVTWACPVYGRKFPWSEFVYLERNPEMLVLRDGRNSGSVAIAASKYSCSDDFRCEQVLTKRPSNRQVHFNAHAGDVWYLKVGAGRSFGYLQDPRNDEYDYVVGIELDEKYTLSIPFWSDFICKHTGACKIGIGEMNNPDSANLHYLLNGKFHFDTCSAEQRREMVRLSTPFRRIFRTDLVSLKRKCGSSKTAILEEDTSFLVTIMANHSEANEIQMCSGVLISHSHVVTSAECLKKILRNATLVAIFFTDHEISENESFPFMKDDLVIPNYDTSRIGKRWSAVNRITTPYTGDATKHDIALLQLELPIPQDSYINPICIPPNSQKVPRRLRLTWNSEQNDPETGLIKRVLNTAEVDTFSESCTVPEDCEIFTVKVPFKVSNSTMGSPVFREIVGQKYLVGYLSLDKDGKEIVIRASYFTSFICLHTGVCAYGESLKSRLFLPYESQNMDIPPYIVVHELNEWKHSSQLNWDQMEKEMESVVKKLAEHKYRLNRLSKEEYEEVKHECGKIAPQNRISDGTDFDINEHPWAVMVAYDWYGILDLTVCGGSFISKRHVITAKHCIDSSQTYVVLYGSVAASKLFSKNRAPVKTIAFADRHEPHVAWHFDLAILELFENIQLSQQTQMLCIGDYKSFYEPFLSPIARIYGMGGTEIIQYLELNLTTNDPLFVRRIHPASSMVEEFGWFSPEGAHATQGDSGGPMVRQRPSDGRYTLYGVVRSMYPTTTIVQVTRIQVALDEICKMTGVCPNGKIVPANMHEISVNGLRLC